MHNKGKGKLLPMSRIAPKRNELSEIDTVASAKRYGGCLLYTSDAADD